MAQFGEVRVDFITFTTGVSPSEGSVTVPVSGLVSAPSFSGDVTITGDLTVGGTIYSQNNTTVSGIFTAETSVLNNVTVTGTLSGTTITGTTAQFTTYTGVSAGFTTVTGATVTGSQLQFNSANFTDTITGVTVSGQTGNFTSGVFTGQISGATITGDVVNVTTGLVQQLNVVSGVFASGTAGAPSITFTGDTDTGFYSPDINTISFTVSGTERWRVSGDGSIYTYGSGALQVPTGDTASRPSPALTGMIRYNTSLESYEGYNAGTWSAIGGGGGATGSGGDQVFVLNEQVVTTSYTLPSGNNATSCGPITVNDGVEVIIGDDQNWAIV